MVKKKLISQYTHTCLDLFNYSVSFKILCLTGVTADACSWFTLVLLRVLDILLLRKLKVRMTLYFSDSTFAGMLYLSNSSSSILKKQKTNKTTSVHFVTSQFCFITYKREKKKKKKSLLVCRGVSWQCHAVPDSLPGESRGQQKQIRQKKKNSLLGIKKF